MFFSSTDTNFGDYGFSTEQQQPTPGYSGVDPYYG